MSGRKIGFLLLLLVFGATIETVWSVHGDLRLGPEGCRVVSGRFYGPSWSFEQTAERALSGAAPRVEISNAFGDVKVIAGAPGVVRAKLRKVVYQPTEDRARAFADRIELRLAGDGQPLRVGTNRSELERGEQVGFETHLQVEAPADTVLTVRNEHGRVDVAGIAAADVTSSFEGVSVERLLGELKVDSRHGDVSVSEVGGPVVLGSRFGAVELRDLRGPARVDLQHGDLKAEQTGALEVRQQYGSLTADGVGGDLVVRATHAELRANDVTGKADLETSFGGVHLERVGGEARGRVEHGGFHAEDVTGGVDAETSHDGITLARVGGPVEAHARFGGLEAHGLARGARVRAENGDVQLEGFSGRPGAAGVGAAATARRSRRAAHGGGRQWRGPARGARGQPAVAPRAVAPRRGAVGAAGARVHRQRGRSRPPPAGAARRRRRERDSARRRRRHPGVAVGLRHRGPADRPAVGSAAGGAGGRHPEAGRAREPDAALSTSRLPARCGA